MALNPPSGIVKWFNHNLVGPRSLATLKGQLTGVKQPGGSSATSYVKLSDKEADEVIENIKKDPEGFPIFDEDNAPDKREEYQKWIVARYLTKAREEGFEGRKEEGIKELEEELGPEGLDELLGLIREEAKVAVAAGSGDGGSSSTGSAPPPPSSSALAVVPKKPEDLVEEDIDSQILSILGLEEVFDLTYEEYASLLKEASIKGRMADSQMTTESIELVTNEFKRVKGKTGSFKVKPKKVDINKVLDRKQPTPPGAIVKSEKLIPTAPEVSPEQQKPAVDTENLQGDLIDGIGNILESLITIRTLLQSQDKTEQKSAQEDKKETEKKKKKERESTLEKKKPVSPILKSITKPVGDFFSAIKKFFTNVLLGSVVLGLFKWLKDPKNQQAIDGFTNFLEKNAGLILGGLLAIAAVPLVSTILGFLAPITAIAIPAIKAAFAFLTSPVGLIALATLAGVTVAYKGIEYASKKFVESEFRRDYGEGNVNKGLFITRLQERYGRINPSEVKNMTPEEQTTASFLKIYDDALKERQKINDKLYRLKSMSDDIRVRPKIRQKEKELKEKDKQLRQMESQISIGGKSFSQLQQEYEAGGEAALPQTSLSKKLGQPAVQPTTPLMPGLPPSAAQPGTGPVGNPVGGGSVVEYITGDATHPNFEYDGHGTTSNYHDHIAFRTKEDKERAKLALRQAGIQIGSEDRPWDTDSYHGAGLAIDIPGAQWGGRGAIGETEYAGSRKVRAVLAAAGFSGAGISGGASGTPSRPAQISRTPAPTPSIPSPTGRGNIVPLPIPTGGGSQQVSSGTAPNQAPVPRFSSEDPNNATTMVVRAIYNIVG